MSTRTRLITTQAAIVSVLVIVVYSIFLSPNGDGPLTGIEAPQTPPPPRYQPAKQDGDGGGRKGDGGPPAVILPPVAPPPEPFVPPSPPHVEYDDSVAQLRTLLRAAEQ